MHESGGALPFPPQEKTQRYHQPMGPHTGDSEDGADYEQPNRIENDLRAGGFSQSTAKTPDG